MLQQASSSKQISAFDFTAISKIYSIPNTLQPLQRVKTKSARQINQLSKSAPKNPMLKHCIDLESLTSSGSTLDVRFSLKSMLCAKTPPSVLSSFPPSWSGRFLWILKQISQHPLLASLLLHLQWDCWVNTRHSHIHTQKSDRFCK